VGEHFTLGLSDQVTSGSRKNISPLPNINRPVPVLRNLFSVCQPTAHTKPFTSRLLSYSVVNRLLSSDEVFVGREIFASRRPDAHRHLFSPAQFDFYRLEFISQFSMVKFEYAPLLPPSAHGNPSIRLLELQPCGMEIDPNQGQVS
jgi:hypothetical protein